MQLQQWQYLTTFLATETNVDYQMEVPPAKKQRLEIPTREDLRDPTTPIDDDLDDLYGTPPGVGAGTSAVQKDEPSIPQDAQTSSVKPPSFSLPGLGPFKSHESYTLRDEYRQGPSADVFNKEQDSVPYPNPPQSQVIPDSPLADLACAQNIDNEMCRSPELTTPPENGVLSLSLHRIGAVDLTIAPIIEEPSAKESLEVMTGTNISEQAQAASSGAQNDELYTSHESERGRLQQTKPAGNPLVTSERDTASANLLEAELLQPMVAEGEVSAVSPISNSNLLIIDDHQMPDVQDGEQATAAMEDLGLKDKPTSNEDGEAEFEIDSSPIGSSSSDISSDSSSSKDSDDGDYERLSPEEQARRLMQEEGGSDDEGQKGRKGGPIRTLNEKPDEIVPKPNVTITVDMPIAELGVVENVVENLVLIKAKTSGEYRVLESGSVLCLNDRTVVGAVAETLGRVQQPFYSVRFTNATAILQDGLSAGVKIYYTERFSTFVFTQSLKAFKGSDASNLHDEEVGDDELEFSDDEAEAEHKRNVKVERAARRGAKQGIANGFSRVPGRGRFNNRGRAAESPSKRYPAAGLTYDDAADGDDLYTPLARPSNLHEMMGSNEAPIEMLSVQNLNDRGGLDFQGQANRGRDRGDYGRGRGDRGRGRGDRGRGGRGDRENRRGRRVDPYTMSRDSRNGVSQQSPSFPQNGGPTSLYNNPPPRAEIPLPQVPPAPSAWSDQGLATYPSWQTSRPQQYSQNNHFSDNSSPRNHYQQATSQFSYQQQSPHGYPSQQSPQFPNPFDPNLADIPTGAFVNPAFFSNNVQQQSSHPQYVPYQQQRVGMPSESDPTFKAAQDRLDVLRNLSRGSGWS